MNKKYDIKELMETGKAFEGFKWPDFCGNFDFVIKADGTWLYQGCPITRVKMLQLFATVLQKDGDEYILVTPGERGKIVVEEAPFFINGCDITNPNDANQKIMLKSNMDWWVTMDKNHKFWIEYDDDDTPHPYIMIRDGLHAKLSRNVFYQIIELCYQKEEGDNNLYIRSDGVEFFVGKF